MTDKEIFESTRKVLYENMIKGHKDGQLSFHYTKPSPGRYPFQFFWDTCFHVFILSALGEHNMAKEHLISLFAMQEEDGFVGHMIYWDRLKPGRVTDVFQSKPRLKNFSHSHMSSLIQPPLAAQAVTRVYKASGDRDFLKDMLPKLKKYYRWLAKNRDFDGDGLLSIISPFESGMDWKPTYDVALGLPEKKANWRLFLKVVGVDLRNYLNNYNLDAIYRKGYFLVKDVGFNTIYTQNLQALANLCKEVGDQDGEQFKALGDKIIQSMLHVMYDEKDAAFYDVYGKENRKIKIHTPTIFYPVVIKGMPDAVTENVIKAHFLNQEEFGVEYPIPSVAKNHPSFNPQESMYIWRGPTWIVNNWFMHQFLMEKGYKKESRKLIDSINQLIEKSGFREYYNPFTGEGYGAKDFTWAGLVTDMIRMEEGKKENSCCAEKKEGAKEC
ncbi:MAG: trehalase-like protein [Anditalea sp.]